MIDTGIFAENRYFDVLVEYAKATPEDILIGVTAFHRWPEPAGLHICRDADDRRAVFGSHELFQNDPRWRDCIPFYE